MAEEHPGIDAAERQRSERRREKREDVVRRLCRPRDGRDAEREHARRHRQERADVPEHARGDEGEHELRDHEDRDEREGLAERRQRARVETDAQCGIAARERGRQTDRRRGRECVDRRDELQESAGRLAAPFQEPRHERAAEGELHQHDGEDERQREDRVHQSGRSPASGTLAPRSIARWKYSLPPRRSSIW